MEAQTTTKSKRTAAIFILYTLGVTVNVDVVGATGRSCPHLKPVPIDQNFLFKKQPTDGFYVSYSSGSDTIPHYTPEPGSVRQNASLGGPHKICVTTEAIIGGRADQTISAPPMDCSYNSNGNGKNSHGHGHGHGSISALYCETPGGSSSSAASPGQAFMNAAVRASRYRLPTSELGVIVDTDNSTYFAWGLCLDGTMYAWAIFTIDGTGSPNSRAVRSKTAHALNVTKEELKESRGKKIKMGRTKFSKGACAGAGSNSMGTGARKGSSDSSKTHKSGAQQIKERVSDFSGLFWSWAQPQPQPRRAGEGSPRNVE